MNILTILYKKENPGQVYVLWSCEESINKVLCYPIKHYPAVIEETTMTEFSIDECEFFEVTEYYLQISLFLDTFLNNININYSSFLGFDFIKISDSEIIEIVNINNNEIYKSNINDIDDIIMHVIKNALTHITDIRTYFINKGIAMDNNITNNESTPSLEECIQESPVEELWEELAKLSQHIVDDNNLMKERNEEYPLRIRQMQLVSIRALVDALEIKHRSILEEKS